MNEPEERGKTQEHSSSCRRVGENSKSPLANSTGVTDAGKNH